MANKIQIKHGSGVPGGGKLSSFELGYATQTGQLYISTTGSNILGITPSSHSHVWAEVTGKPAQATRWPTWSEVTGTFSLPNGRLAVYITTTWDLNDVVEEWVLGANGSNFPASGYWYVNTIMYSNLNQRKQIAYGYTNDSVYTRYLYGGAWSSWRNISNPLWSDVSSKPTTATRWPTWSEVTSKPSTFAPSSHTHDYAPSSHTHAYVPTSRPVNSKALSANISLTAADVGAAATSHKSAYTLLRSSIAVAGNTSITFTDSGQHNMYAVYSYDTSSGVGAWACTIVPATTSTTRYYVRTFVDCYTFKFGRSGTTCTLTRDSATQITYMVYGLG